MNFAVKRLRRKQNLNTCNPKRNDPFQGTNWYPEIHVDYWCTLSGVFQRSCLTWINGVPVHVDITCISCEECHLILFHLFPRVFFTWINSGPIHVYIG